MTALHRFHLMIATFGTATGDTVSNKNDDNAWRAVAVASFKRGLSPSDSGKMISIQRRDEFPDGSFLDLQVESGYQQSRPKPKSGTQRRAERKRLQRSCRRRIRCPASGEVAAANEQKGMDPMLIGALLLAFFIVAVALGFFLARVTGRVMVADCRAL